MTKAARGYQLVGQAPAGVHELVDGSGPERVVALGAVDVAEIHGRTRGARGLGRVIATAAAVFGAVFVVSGHIAGKTDTMPLRVEKLFQEYNMPGAFAVASVLALRTLPLFLVESTVASSMAWYSRSRSIVRDDGGVTSAAS